MFYKLLYWIDLQCVFLLACDSTVGLTDTNKQNKIQTNVEQCEHQ